MEPILSEPPRATGVAAFIGRTVLWLTGWRWGTLKALPPRCIIMVYPHTSNWDFPIGIAYKWASGIDVNYLGKASLFTSPLGWFFRATGGLPVDRSQPRGMVGGMIEALKTRKLARFVVAPEGTRAYSPTLKTGFYRAAVEGKVPLILSTIDFKTKFVGIFDHIEPTGDEQADLAALRERYAHVEGKILANMAPFAFPPKK